MADSIGAWGEAQACHFLQEKGYRILSRNYHTWEGEIDIIAEKNDAIVFVEVKTRASSRFGSPEESMGKRKQMRLLKSGYKYLEEYKLMEAVHQFDLIAIECSPDRRIKRIAHYEDVIGQDLLE